MKTYQNQLLIFKIIIDVLLIGACLTIAATLSHGTAYNPLDTKNIYILIVVCLIWYLVAKGAGLYDEFRSRDFSVEFVVLLKALTIHLIGIVFALFLMKETILSRSFVLYYSATGLLILGTEKFMLRILLERIRRRGRNLRNILIIGAGYIGRKFQQSVQKNPQYGYRFLGYLDDKPRPSLNGEHLGDIEKLEDILTKQNVDDVIIALPSSATNRIQQVIRTCENYPVHVRILPDYSRFLSPKFHMSMFDTFPVISVRSYALEELHWRFAKRTFDIIFTSLLFITLFWWLMPLIALAIKLTSRGPVLFKQERWGKNNEKIVCYKFRSMIASSTDVDDRGKYRQARKNDPRITWIGRILRESNLDEIPQFINVLRGEMSVVGPRPHPTPLNLESKDTIQYYMRRHLVKPGITGWAQINGFRGETSDPRQMQKRIEHDIWYIENWSFLFDLQIILLTVLRTIKGDPMAY
jgi:putative colanic acid biosysnthesis UDP-glucose lipid carrier transferase